MKALIKNIFSGAMLALCSTVLNAEPLPMDTSLRYGILDNGLTYYVKSNKTDKGRADFYIVQNVGAILEEDGQQGLAHFLEHMAFNGTKNYPGKGIVSYLETKGVRFGAEINAYTAQDETVYNMNSVPTDKEETVDSCIMVLHDWSGFISLEDKEIDAERGVIVEEWRTRNTASRRLWKKASQVLYAGTRYADRDVIGDTSIIKNFKPDTLRAFYNRWYRPDLQAVIIVGDIDADRTVASIRAAFSDIPKRVNPQERFVQRLKGLNSPIACVLTDPEAPHTRIDIVWRHAPVDPYIKSSLQGYIFDVANSIISIMTEWRIDEITKESNTPISHLYAEYGELVKSADAYQCISIAHEGRCKEAAERMLKMTEQMRRYGFTQSELDRAKAELRSHYEHYYLERNKTKNNSYVAEYKRNFLDFEPVPGIEWEYDHIDQVLSTINLGDINGIVKEYFDTKQIHVLITAPDSEKSRLLTESEAVALVNNASDLKVEPYVDKTPAGKLIEKLSKPGKVVKVEKGPYGEGNEVWTLSNGAKVIVLPTTNRDDQILFTAVADGGMSRIEDDKLISDAMLADGFIEASGRGLLDEVSLSKALAGKNLAIETNIQRYNSVISGSTVTADFDTFMQLLYLYQSAPRKDQDAYIATRDKYVNSLRNRTLDPMSTFQDSIQMRTNGYSKYSKILDASKVESVDYGKMMNIYSDMFCHPEEFTYIFVGNIDKEILKESVCKYIAGRKGAKTKGSRTHIDRGIRPKSGECVFSRDMNISKTAIYLEMDCPAKYDRNNKVLATIVKNILNYRYLESCREEKGGTYGVGVRCEARRLPEEVVSLRMSLTTDPKMESEMRRLLIAEIDTIIEKGVRADDLQKAKEAQIKSYNQSILENNHYLGNLLSWAVCGWMMDERDGDKSAYIEAVSKVDSDAVVSMLKRLKSGGVKIEVVMRPNE